MELFSADAQSIVHRGSSSDPNMNLNIYSKHGSVQVEDIFVTGSGVHGVSSLKIGMKSSNSVGFQVTAHASASDGIVVVQNAEMNLSYLKSTVKV